MFLNIAGVAEKSLGFQVLVTALIWSIGATMFAPNSEGQPPVAKSEGSSSPPIVGPGVSMRVLWTISEYKAGENAIWGKKEAQSMIFKPLNIDATTITFDGKTCRDVIFKERR